MKRLLVLMVITFFFFNSHSQNNKSYTPKDLAALQLLPTSWERYWNNHDMDSMGTLLADDVDFITVGGTWLKGKVEAVMLHKKNHATIFKKSIWTTDSVAVKYIKPDLALMHLKWGIQGDFDTDGTARTPRQGVFSWIVIKQNNQWLLLAVHNVNVRQTPAK